MKASPPIKTLKAPPTLKTVTERVVVREPRKSPNTTIAATSYSVADLQAATNSFAQESLVGEGSLGRVYRGDFQDGQVLAVKKLDTSAPLVQNEQDFLGVVSNIARLRHANITELVGYCAEHGQRLLVYEYLNHGTLNDILHSNEDNVKRLSWNVRVKIALGAARALEYLHEVCLPAVVHRNFKSGNVLLDDELNPHVSDCGIADLSPLGSDHQVSPQIPGSFGYSAPEYAMSGIYTVKSDVYSFGVVMLELLTGRKPLDSSRPRAEQSLVRWATPQLHDIDALAKMVDPALKGIYPAKSLSRFADIIALCVQPEPEFRPPMSELVQALVRLMQRASLSKRRSGDDRSLDHHDTTDISG
jgi:serine/threonine protein kinase